MNDTRNFPGKLLSWELEMIKFRKAPVVVPNETQTFVLSIPDVNHPQGIELWEFIRKLPIDTIGNQVIAECVPAPIRELLIESDRMAQKKEEACAGSEFTVAKQWLRKEQALRSEIVSLVPVPIAVEPRHVIQVLRSLGYAGQLPDPS